VGIPASSRAKLKVPNGSCRDLCHCPTWSYIVVVLLVSVLTQIVWQVRVTKLNGNELSYAVVSLGYFMAGKMAEA
jgi:hypothetical protein